MDYTYTVLDTDTRSSTLTRRPRHQVGFETTWTPIDALSLTGSAQWVDPYLDIPRDDLTGTLYTMPPSYLVVGVSARYTIIKGLDLTARVTNLLNRQYEPANGFQAPGIEALAGVAVSF
ncbi:MAG: TonB-dependent receptor [Alphaproteobacteria bacterium]|nr:TonB-dependent receptor [Alphaproteobacteria bacterium]